MAEMTFGERLCHLRESKGWLQRDLASLMNVKSNTISNWEKGISRPNLEQLAQLCQLLNVTADSILGLDKTGFQRTLSLKEQMLLCAFHNCSSEMQTALYNFIRRLDDMNHSIFEKTVILDAAEAFIDASDLHDEWEIEKEGLFPKDEDED